MKVSALALAIVALAGMSTTTVRADEREMTQKTVSLKGIDFNNKTEVASLYDRLSYVARNVCQSDSRSMPGVSAQDQACAREALDEAVNSVGDQHLSRLHATRSSDKTEAVATAYAAPAK